VKQTHPESTELHWIYGNDGRLTWIASYDELGHEKTLYGDAYGRISQIRETNKGQYSYTTFTYNAVDEALSLTDDGGNVTTNTWDLLGRKIKTSDPDMGIWTYKYDLVGNLKSQTDANGVTLTFTYDALDRIKTKVYPSGDTVRWNYDEAHHGASTGRLTSVIEPTAPFGAGCASQPSEQYQYDGMGQVTGKTKCVDGRSYTMAFGYDMLGRQSEILYDPDGEVLRYTYDSAGQLKSVSGYVDNIQYDAAGNMTMMEYSNRTVERFTYDPNRQWLKDAVVSSGRQQLYEAAYQYHPNGIIKSSSSTTNNMNLTFTYDDLNSLMEVRGDWQQSFTYNSLGNMTSNSGVGTYTYPVSGPTGCTKDVVRIPCQGPHAVKQAGPLTHKYDANGNMFEVFDSAVQAKKNVSWNYDNKPEWMWDYNGVATHALYDAWGDRVIKWRGSEYTRYYSPFLEDSSSKGVIKYYFAGTLLVARKDSTGTYWYHQDNLGSTRLMTDGRGAVVARYDYKPFGEKTNWSGPLTNDVQFTGQRTDEENGLIYMNARYYDPRLARFISADSIIPDGINPQALNRYSYVYNNPMGYIDPKGHQGCPPQGVEGCYDIAPEPNNTAPAPTILMPEMTIEGRMPPAPTILMPEMTIEGRMPPAPAVKADVAVVEDMPSGKFIYRDADTAAVNVIRAINPTSKHENLEYTGFIMEYGGKFAFSRPVPVGEQGGSIGTPPTGPKIIGYYHTHGEYNINLGHGNEIFSTADKDTSRRIGIGYLGTPFGKILKFDPRSGKEFIYNKGKFVHVEP
jgi:RHS repeat-associated protein